jgi:hypothetical protein
MEELIITEDDLVFKEPVKSRISQYIDWVQTPENRGAMIHMVADIILFYLCFRYIQFRFHAHRRQNGQSVCCR